MSLEAHTDLDGIHCRLAQGPVRWLPAAFSSIFMGSGTFAMTVAVTMPFIMVQEAGWFGLIPATPFMVIPGIIGVAHFSAGVNGVWQALREVRIDCDMHRVRVRVSAAGLVSWKTLEMPLHDVLVLAEPDKLTFITEEATHAIPMTGAPQNELEAIAEMITLAAERHADAQPGGAAPEELLDLLQRRAPQAQQAGR